MNGLTRRGLLGAGAAAPLGVLGMPALAEESTAFELPSATDAITPFRLRVPEAALIDLNRRLAQARWPEPETVPDVTQGAQLVFGVPIGYTTFPGEILPIPKIWAERLYKDKLVYFNKVARGGHFAAFEQPAIFVDEVRKFARLIR